MISRAGLTRVRCRAAPADRATFLRRECGSITLEIVILVPALLAVIFGIVQGALVFHARHVALAAAAEGLAAAGSHDSSAAAGAAAARDFLTAAGGPDVLSGASVDVRHTATEVEVTVTGQAPVLIPGIRGWTVSQRASGPVERFAPEDLP